MARSMLYCRIPFCIVSSYFYYSLVLINNSPTIIRVARSNRVFATTARASEICSRRAIAPSDFRQPLGSSRNDE
ncbi:hypothetical protein OH77DRAFT_1431244 [Trametes cingulata]|nr:hypothetical protein OH77DRAFT_1431244 [Trametes cingulata]